MSKTTSPSARPGRPRSPQADAAVLSAALDELQEVGYARFTMEGVARRAGVGRPTVYRRYPSKAALVVAACHDISARTIRVPDTGTVEGDVVTLITGLAWVFTATRARTIVPALSAAGADQPELAAAARAVWQPRRDVMRSVLQRAVDRGELPTGAADDAAIDLLYAPIYYRLLVTRAPLDPPVARHFAELALAGLRSQPGRDPTPAPDQLASGVL